MIDLDLILKITPDANRALVNRLIPPLNRYTMEAGISTPLRLAHFLAQVAHESAHFRTLTEYWGPTPAQKRYEGNKDLGNTEKGDGRRYMGRGLIQLTGRANYRAMGSKLGLDLVADPELAATPEVAVRTAVEFWRWRGLNAIADKDNLKLITKRINGGSNGLTERGEYLKRAKAAIAAARMPVALVELPPPPETPASPVADSATVTSGPSGVTGKPVLHHRRVWTTLTGWAGGVGSGIFGMFSGWDWTAILVMGSFLTFLVLFFWFMYRKEIAAGMFRA